MRDAENSPRGQFPGDRAGRPGEAEGPGAPFNERSYGPPADMVRTLPRSGGRGRDEDEPAYVIHLQVRVPDLAAATALAGTVATDSAIRVQVDAVGEDTALA
ncbi:hypothetical protein M5W98_30710, partial [Paenibacillus apiarius]|nr:hypothetical protein [Paenibacillus apiarius]